MVVGRSLPEQPFEGVFFKSCAHVAYDAGVAEVVKGAGLKIRSRMGSWVRIPPPAFPLKSSFNSPS